MIRSYIQKLNELQVSFLMFFLYEFYSLCFKFFIKPFGLHMERWIIVRSFEYHKGYFLLEIFLFTIFETYIISKVADFVHQRWHHPVWTILGIAFFYAFFYAIIVHPFYGLFIYPFAVILMYVHEVYEPRKMTSFTLFLIIHALLNMLPAFYACIFL